MIDLITMLSNLSKSLPSVQHLLGGVSYVLGIVFCMVGLNRLRENHEKGPQSGDPKSKTIVPVAYLMAGAGLLFMPTMFDAFSNTLFGSGSSVLEYAGYQPYDVYSSMTILIETIGIVWFIRGCVLIAHASHPEQGREGSKGFGGKGLLFIIAGLFGINFHSTVNMMDTIMNYILSLTVTQY